jgi:hypothetical protein
MHDSYFKMKDGSIYEGPIWESRMAEGWVSISDHASGGDLVKIHLRDVEEAWDEDRHSIEDRNKPGGVSRLDLLEFARERGWDGT